MSEIVQLTQFKRDVKLAGKRGKDMAKLRELILMLADGAVLPARFKDHLLSGDWKHHRDSHIEPEWLLIYKAGFSSTRLMAMISISSEPALMLIRFDA